MLFHDIRFETEDEVDFFEEVVGECDLKWDFHIGIDVFISEFEIALGPAGMV